MRPLVAVALVALLAASLAGCADDPERYPDGVPTSSSRSTTSAAPSTTASATASASQTGTSRGGPSPNQAPTANLSATPGSGAAPLNVTFQVSASDPESDPLSWTLHFGDGNQTNGTTLPSSVVHTYAKPGNYTASLVVSDGSLNRTATAQVAVTGPGGGGPAAGPTIEELCPTDSLAVGHEMAGYYVTPADTVDEPGSVWVYEESNGLPGLQRNDATQPHPECPTPDTIIF